MLCKGYLLILAQQSHPSLRMQHSYPGQRLVVTAINP